MERLRSQRSGSGVDLPRRGGPLAPRWAPSSVQSGRFVPRAAPRPSYVPTRGDRETEALRRFTPRGVLALGLPSFPRSHANRRRLASDRGPPRGQQALSDTQDENGDPEVSTVNSKTGGPLGLLRLKRRVLLPGHRPQGQGGFHRQPRRAAVADLRAVDGVFPKPVRFPETN